MSAARPGDEDGASPSLHGQLVGGAHLRQGWDALATLLSAMLLFGLPAWWLAGALDQPWVTGAGLVVGMTAAVLLVWFRYGVPAHDGAELRARRRRPLAGMPMGTTRDREEDVQ